MATGLGREFSNLGGNDITIELAADATSGAALVSVEDAYGDVGNDLIRGDVSPTDLGSTTETTRWKAAPASTASSVALATTRGMAVPALTSQPFPHGRELNGGADEERRRP